MLLQATAGHFLARGWGGGGASVYAGKIFDLSKTYLYAAVNSGSYGWCGMLGTVQTSNGPDNSLYLSPVLITEPSTGTIRGRLRGIYQVCHPIASFSDGQTFSGGGDYAGKSFQIIKGMVNGGFCAVETSATVETN